MKRIIPKQMYLGRKISWSSHPELQKREPQTRIDQVIGLIFVLMILTIGKT